MRRAVQPVSSLGNTFFLDLKKTAIPVKPFQLNYSKFYCICVFTRHSWTLFCGFFLWFKSKGGKTRIWHQLRSCRVKRENHHSLQQVVAVGTHFREYSCALLSDPHIPVVKCISKDEFMQRWWWSTMLFYAESCLFRFQSQLPDNKNDVVWI